jgi:hypothetical protein
MSRATNTLGVLFLILGCIVAIAASAVMIVSRSFNIPGAIVLGIGFLSAVFGALFVEPDAAKTALHTLGSEASPYIPTGGRRACDPDERPEPSEPKG